MFNEKDPAIRAEAIRLRTVEEKTLPEIATLLKQPQSTVNRWLRGMKITKTLPSLQRGYKACIDCKETKTVEFFNKKNNSIAPYCKVGQAIRWKKYYEIKENRDKTVQKQMVRNRVKQAETNDFIIDYLEKHPCVDCGEKDIVLLQFDHQRDKSRDVSKMRSDRCTLEKILAEIDKCEVRCVSCHTRRTAKQFGWYRIKQPD